MKKQEDSQLRASCTLILGFEALEMKGKKCLPFKPCSLWYSVMAD